MSLIFDSKWFSSTSVSYLLVSLIAFWILEIVVEEDDDEDDDVLLLYTVSTEVDLTHYPSSF